MVKWWRRREEKKVSNIGRCARMRNITRNNTHSIYDKNNQLLSFEKDSSFFLSS